MTFLPHWNTITPNTNVHLPDRWIFFDTETSGGVVDDKTVDLTLRLGSACYWRRARGRHKAIECWKDFNVAGVFWRWVLEHAQKRQTLYLCAHNAAFDLLVTKGFSTLATLGFRLTRVYHRGLTTIVRFASGTRRLCVIDTMNYYPTKLEEIGEHVGLRKLRMPHPDDSPDAWYLYCRQDVRIVKAAIERMLLTLESSDLGSFKPTGPGMAWSIFRHKYMAHKLEFHHLTNIARMERDAYVGSVTMPFRLLALDSGPYYKLDVNSMYPSVMVNHDYPRRFVRALGRMTPKELSKWLRKYLVVARVELVTEDAIYPLRTGGRVLYPVGAFSSTLATRGLKHALKRGHVADVVWCYLYEGAPIFSGYVRGLYERKSTASSRGDRAGALFWKMCLNGLYGKFGQRSREIVKVGECDPNLFYTEEQWDAYRHLPITMTFAGGVQTMSRDAGETRNSFPAISAHVTEDARLKLFGLIERAGKDNVLYCDTDSLIVNGAGLSNLRDVIDPERLGCLKLEATGNSFVALGKKDYLFAGKRVLKGFKHANSTTIFTREQQEQFTGLAGALRVEHSEIVRVRKVVKQHDPYVAGVQVSDDLVVRPLRWPTDRNAADKRTYLRPMMEMRLREWQGSMRHE
jgi:hypothetical protein